MYFIHYKNITLYIIISYANKTSSVNYKNDSSAGFSKKNKVFGINQEGVFKLRYLLILVTVSIWIVLVV